MNILNLPHLNVVPGDLLERVDRVWISGQKSAIITKSDEVYTIDTNDSVNAPIYIPKLCGKKVIDIIFGGDFIIALNVNGQLYSWGENGHGQLGLGHKTSIHIPTMISYLSDKRVVKVVCGQCTAMALCENGEVFRWGFSIATPTKFNKVNSGVSIACCFKYVSFNFYHLDDGAFSNSENYIGRFFNEKGENKVRFSDGYIEFKNTIEKVACGYSHVMVLDSEGKVHIARYPEKTFIQLDIPERIIDIAASSISSFSAAMADSKTIFVWTTEGIHINCFDAGPGILIRPYPTSFVSFQEAFLNLSHPVTSYGVYHLKATNLTKNLNIDMLESIIKTFDEPEFSDLTVLVEEKKIHVHKVILDARSSYFRAMFRERWQENKEKAMYSKSSKFLRDLNALQPNSQKIQDELKIKDYPYETFKNYLKYLYGMEIDITSENVIDLMTIADQYMDENLEHLITKKVENDETISRPIKLLREIIGLPESEYEVLCKGLSRLVFSKDSYSKS